MNLQELSELVQVTAHLRNVINSASYTRFNSNTIATLKKRMAEFDELFISEILNYDERRDAKAIHDAIKDARAKMGLDQKYPVILSSKGSKQEDVKEEDVKEDKKSLTRRNAKSTVNNDSAKMETKTVEEEVSTVTKKEEREVKQLSKTAAPPSVNQPYLEDQSLAALLAAEKQKIASKKRKS